MHKRIAKKWTKLLRSGLIKQGDGRLRNENNEMCCLGLLCQLHAEAHPEIAKSETNPLFYLGATAILPESVMVWAGMNTRFGSWDEINHLGDRESLTNWNDTLKKNFHEIADKIDEIVDLL